MDQWAALEPVRLYDAPAASGRPTSLTAASRILGRSRPIQPRQAYIGPLPVDIHVLVASHLPITAIPTYARASRATAAVCRDEKIWKKHWAALGVERYNLAGALERLKEGRGKGGTGPATMNVVEQDVIDDDDDFGAFASASARSMSGGVSPSTSFGISDSFGPPTFHGQHGGTHADQATYRQKYIQAHCALKPSLPALLSAPHLILSTLFPSSNADSSKQPSNGNPSPFTIVDQSRILRLLSFFLSPKVQPVLAWPSLLAALKSAVDRFEANLLTAFDTADGRRDEEGMRDAAWASWEVYDGRSEWELGKVWAEKKEVFYETGRWDPIKNITPSGSLDFQPMDEFISRIIDAIHTDGATAVRVFPPDSQVLCAFADRLAIEVVSEYITPLLSQARSVSNQIFLKATAATFVQAWRMVDALLEVATSTSRQAPGGGQSVAQPVITRNQAEDIVFRMFEQNMDDYLDEELESAEQTFEIICKEWHAQSSNETSRLSVDNVATQTRFLASSNPAQVKRNVLASFTDVLLLPVTIVPRTMGAVVGGARVGANAAVNGISMLNPHKWGGGGGGVPGMSGGGGGGSMAMGYGVAGGDDDYEGGAAMFELEDEEDEDNEVDDGVEGGRSKRGSLRKSNGPTLVPPSLSITASDSGTSPLPYPSAALSRTGSSTTLSQGSPKGGAGSFDRLQLLLSLDTALEIIHADRESLKRAETFQHYPGSYGHRVRETIEELFILMLQALSAKHIQPGFTKAMEQMQTYKPAEHEETESVAPLMQFFELVHIGDTMQSMVQVFFDKELAPHIDKTDFLNGVVREKKRFENTLDDSVAAGLNTGTEVLMSQVEHIIIIRTGPREYYPAEGVPMDLRPTKGCTEAIRCLETHCKLLKGSTSKEVLEVFYQEVGIRLHAIIQKHLKRQIISLQGGFQVIADLNSYHAFISSLKVPQITSDFASLKMLGSVYIVEDAKDLAQIVRDVTRYGGTFRPEDVYEFIQRRSDWKKIEKTVDKTMYNLSFKEDCVII
ncbi:F-box protein: endocytic membrane traffic, recycling ReCYcling 1 [Tulasnella sp. 331]|nr:F-box protein: endocytic membrane traffic, recycling ReCYcling 1 [Tulasnella sp. 331]KAG8882324.1 F-box protein: endocytic membrane traffic, recycling ReCYcling 1 [Tulasnella sp. 332]